MRKGAVICCATVLLLGTVVLGARAAGLRVNLTPSMPIGIWQLHREPVRRGSIIVVCPPENDVARQGARRGYLAPGNCPGGSEPLVKPVAAVAGDLVEVSPAGVSVNGFRVPSSAPLWRDSAGRSLAPLVGVHLIRPGELWLLSGRDARSFDSRYFGPVPLANVRGVARPVLVR